MGENCTHWPLNRLPTKVRCVFILSMSLLCMQQSAAQEIIAHAHNDYEKPQPLWNALAHDFHSLEIDIARYGQELVVTHTLDSLAFKPTLQELYIEPLISYLDTASRSLWLLVDLKSYDRETLDLLHALLVRHDDVFLGRQDNIGSKPVQVILSGEMPRAEIIADDRYSYFFIDGRIENLGQGYKAHTMPLISANFTSLSSWTGEKEMNLEDEKKLRDLVRTVKAENKKLRFWKTNDSEEVWKKLMALGVHVIGVDHVEEFHDAVLKRIDN